MPCSSLVIFRNFPGFGEDALFKFRDFWNFLRFGEDALFKFRDFSGFSGIWRGRPVQVSGFFRIFRDLAKTPCSSFGIFQDFPGFGEDCSSFEVLRDFRGFGEDALFKFRDFSGFAWIRRGRPVQAPGFSGIWRGRLFKFRYFLKIFHDLARTHVEVSGVFGIPEFGEDACSSFCIFLILRDLARTPCSSFVMVIVMATAVKTMKIMMVMIMLTMLIVMLMVAAVTMTIMRNSPHGVAYIDDDRA